jgi:hypothetical protein
MPEAVTQNALKKYYSALRPHMTEDFALELNLCIKEIELVSNWTDCDRWMKKNAFTTLAGQGPFVKVMRVIAFALEKFAQSFKWEDSDSVITGIKLENCASGCSNFSGVIHATLSKDGKEEEVFSGTFNWDCAAWGEPQQIAAIERGYACMIDFPDNAPINTTP